MKTASIFRSIAIAAALAAAAVPSFATTNQVALSGTLAASSSLTVTAATAASALPIGTATANLQVATVVELSNDKAGYKVTLASANSGVLQEASGPDTLPYTLAYGASSGTATAVNFSNPIATASTRTSGSGTTNYLYMSFGTPYINADTYSDTLTFTITGN